MLECVYFRFVLVLDLSHICFYGIMELLLTLLLIGKMI